MIQNVLLASLAVYRVAYMIAVESGPFYIFPRLKGLVYERADKATANTFSWYGWQSLSEGVDCPLCISFWLSIIVALLMGKPKQAMSIAGGALVIHKVLNK